MGLCQSSDTVSPAYEAPKPHNGDVVEKSCLPSTASVYHHSPIPPQPRCLSHELDDEHTSGAQDSGPSLVAVHFERCSSEEPHRRSQSDHAIDEDLIHVEIDPSESDDECFESTKENRHHGNNRVMRCGMTTHETIYLDRKGLQGDSAIQHNKNLLWKAFGSPRQGASGANSSPGLGTASPATAALRSLPHVNVSTTPHASVAIAAPMQQQSRPSFPVQRPLTLPQQNRGATPQPEPIVKDSNPSSRSVSGGGGGYHQDCQHLVESNPPSRSASAGPATAVAPLPEPQHALTLVGSTAVVDVDENASLSALASASPDDDGFKVAFLRFEHEEEV